MLKTGHRTKYHLRAFEFLAARRRSRAVLTCTLLASFLATMPTGGLQAGDILRGGASAGNAKRNSEARANAGAAAAQASKVRAQDRLARTTKAVNDMRALQASARAAAGASAIPNGLTEGGLKVLTGANAKWEGANPAAQSGTTVGITQTAAQALLHWETFNVGSQTTVNFDQSAGGADSGKWIAFNKVFDPTAKPSEIRGKINAQGQVYIINQNGIIFGAGSQVNARTLVASALPINDQFLKNGLLVQPKTQEFLFSAEPDGSFTPPAAPISGKYGDVTVERGARLESTLNAAGGGGRIVLAGANVLNDGEILTPSGQTILAAGLQVGFQEHPSNDPSLRGLDVFVGRVDDKSGRVTQSGFVSIPTGNLILAGKSIVHSGVTDSLTSVTLNGRVDLLASYNAVRNVDYDPVNNPGTPAFLNRSTGDIVISAQSVVQVIPDYSSAATTIGTRLPTLSQINLLGKNISLGESAAVIAKNGVIDLKAGEWRSVIELPDQNSYRRGEPNFVFATGDIDLHSNALLDVSGSTDVFLPLNHNLVEVQLRGSELAVSPTQRDGAIRGVKLMVDLRKSGEYNGRKWIGTPLGDATGFANIIERTAAQLTTSGGTISLQSGGQISMAEGSGIDVSGGFFRNEQGPLATSKLLVDGRTLVDISEAVPDRVYSGIFSDKSTKPGGKWGQSQTFLNPLAPSASNSQTDFITGGDGGSLSLTAPVLALQGTLLGKTLQGPKQIRSTPSTSHVPIASSLRLAFTGQSPLTFTGIVYPTISPTPPKILFTQGSSGLLSSKDSMVFGADFFKLSGFGSLEIENPEGDFSLDGATSLELSPGSQLVAKVKNAKLDGKITAPSGTIQITAYVFSPYQASILKGDPLNTLPKISSTDGTITLAPGAILSTAGLVTDDRVTGQDANIRPVAYSGGSIKLDGYNVLLGANSLIDVSSGVVLPPSGKPKYGLAGDITIRGGADPGLRSLTGGSLALGGRLEGFSPANKTGGTLRLTAPLVQIGGLALHPSSLVVSPEFFSRGGFSSFELNGLGVEPDDATFNQLRNQTGDPKAPDYFLPAVFVDSGVQVNPIPLTRILQTNQPDGPAWISVSSPEDLSPTVSISLAAPGITHDFRAQDPITGEQRNAGELKIRGDVLVSSDASFSLPAKSKFSLSGQTISFLGKVSAPSGSITLAASKKFPSFDLKPQSAKTTLFIGSSAELSAQGIFKKSADSYGRSRGDVLPGGTISLTGNLFLDSKSILDVSGIQQLVDLTPWEAGITAYSPKLIDPNPQGLPSALRTIPTQIESNGGTILLAGGELLVNKATLRARPGGENSLGGALQISSSRFYLDTDAPTSADFNLSVTQKLSSDLQNASSRGIGFSAISGSQALLNGGFFAVNQIEDGGFSTLKLGGNVDFQGDVSIQTTLALDVAEGGVLRADGRVSLKSPYVKIGRIFRDPLLPADDKTLFTKSDPSNPIYTFPPTAGSGSLEVVAKHIDIGTLSLANIGNARFSALGGGIRGNGIFQMAGNLQLDAAAIYPTSAGSFEVFVYDPAGDTGSIKITSSGSIQTPLSAGGRLAFNASLIEQGGTLLAPLGEIRLGWDGRGTAPVNAVAGVTISTPVTQSLRLLAGSTTSVAGIDNVSGEELVFPYGVSFDGLSWVDPAGQDITDGNLLPKKSISLAGNRVLADAGSNIDLRGGGDLYAYQWIEGNGGPIDILAASPVYKGESYLYGTGAGYAIVPGYESELAPYAPFNSSSKATLLNNASGVRDTGYTHRNLSVGQKIILDDSSQLPAGSYTLLPARYALLPGALLLTPISGKVRPSYLAGDQSSIVSGVLANGLAEQSSDGKPRKLYELSSRKVLSKRADYRILSANSFFPEKAASLGLSQTTRLPKDASHLTVAATTGLIMAANILAIPPRGGLGATGDFYANSLFIGQSDTSQSHGAVLNSNRLSSYGFESLVLGGQRIGEKVVPISESVLVDNAGSSLEVSDLAIVAKNSLAVAGGSSIQATQPATQSAQDMTFAGGGSFVRVSSSGSPSMTRLDASNPLSTTISIGKGVLFNARGLIIDSTRGLEIDSSASLRASAIRLGAGQISVVLSGTPVLTGDVDPSTPDLILADTLLASATSGSSLSLSSYQNVVDFYGAGTFGSPSLSQFVINAGAIRGIGLGASAINLRAQSVFLGNPGGASSPTSLGTASGKLQILSEVLTLQSGDLDLSNFQDILVSAPKGVLFEGSGSLTAEGNIEMTSSRLAGTKGAKYGLAATGSLLLSRSTAVPTVDSGLGASLTFTGSNLDVSTDIRLPSGFLSLVSNGPAGQISVSGTLDVSGSSRTLFDVVQFTDGGQISLASTAGDVSILNSGLLRANAPTGGGNSGEIRISTPRGLFSNQGSFEALAAPSATGGRFVLDTNSAADFGALLDSIQSGGFTTSQNLRLRTGDAIVSGVVNAQDFRLSTDAGSIQVSGTIDASGSTGGAIALFASKDVRLLNGSLLDARGDDFSSSGKGGLVQLEAGSAINGISDASARLEMAPGSRIELGVATYVAGEATDMNSSAFQGKFTGTLHLRAPRTNANTSIGILPIGGDIVGASKILAEGFKVYSSAGTITNAIQNQIHSEAQSYLGASGTASASYSSMMTSLLSTNPFLQAVLVLMPGAEVVNTSGGLTLGTSSSTSSSDWNLSTFRYGPKRAPGILTLKSQGDMVFYNALSDGFSPTLPSSNGSWLWLAPLSEIATATDGHSKLPMNAQSWSYRLSSGADFASADYQKTDAASASSATYGGSVRLGKNYDQAIFGTSGNSFLTSTAVSGRFQVIRTGTGDIDISSAKDVALLNPFASIYSAGVRLPDYTSIFSSNDFSVPIIIDSQSQGNLGAAQRSSATRYPVQYAMAGGDIRISALGELHRKTGADINDSSRQLPSNWLYRRGFVNQATGEYGIGGYQTGPINVDANPASTTWWVDYSNFFAGVGALGGGDIHLTAAGNIENFDAAIPTNARTPKGLADATKIQETGGGDLLVESGADIDAGVYYVERGQGVLKARGAIVTNSTRSPSFGIIESMTSPKLEDSLTWLPTTLFIGKSSFQVQAQQDILLGPIASAFLLPQGTNNRYWNKSYFTTFAPTSGVQVTSLGGSITHRTEAQLPTSPNPRPLLGVWMDTQMKLANTNASYYQPWLRLAETSVESLDTLTATMPPNLKSIALSGDINLSGDLTLFPSRSGTIELLAAGHIHALQPLGFSDYLVQGQKSLVWKSSTITLSDVSPASLPGIANPLSATALLGRSRTLLATTASNIFSSYLTKFDETGSFTGSFASAAFQTNLHDTSLLHASDNNPVRLYAAGGNLEGLTVFSSKAARIFASYDIADVALYIQNTSSDDVSIVSADRDILPYLSSASLRALSSAPGNAVANGSGPLAGDIQISGPGVLEVLAGRNLDLGTAAQNDDGTGAGISSIGNLRNPALPDTGSNLLVMAGIGPSIGLAQSLLKLNTFADNLQNSGNSDSNSQEYRALKAIDALFEILRQTAVEASETGSYERGSAAINALFDSGNGRITTHSRDIVTRSGGQLSVLAPYGDIAIASTIKDVSATPPGILTEYGGAVQILTDGDVSIGKGRIFTLRGGDITIWSSSGDIAAGTSAKTVVSAPPTRVSVDVQSATVETDLAGLATGGGIGVLAAVESVPAGDVFLIAPEGIVDAGDAGIRATGDLTIAATAVLNADNISISGSSAGVPTTAAPSAPSVSGLSAGSTTAATNTAAESVAQQSQRPTESIDESPSLISVEVVGYGGGEGDSKEDEDKEG
jgi:filamentous hemagglutinin family protein